MAVFGRIGSFTISSCWDNWFGASEEKYVKLS